MSLTIGSTWCSAGLSGYSAFASSVNVKSNSSTRIRVSPMSTPMT
jgi:hypothetical protein